MCQKVPFWGKSHTDPSFARSHLDPPEGASSGVESQEQDVWTGGALELATPDQVVL